MEGSFPFLKLSDPSFHELGEFDTTMSPVVWGQSETLLKGLKAVVISQMQWNKESVTRLLWEPVALPLMAVFWCEGERQLRASLNSAQKGSPGYGVV